MPEVAHTLYNRGVILAGDEIPDNPFRDVAHITREIKKKAQGSAKAALDAGLYHLLKPYDEKDSPRLTGRDLPRVPRIDLPWHIFISARLVIVREKTIDIVKSLLGYGRSLGEGSVRYDERGFYITFSDPTQGSAEASQRKLFDACIKLYKESANQLAFQPCRGGSCADHVFINSNFEDFQAMIAAHDEKIAERQRQRSVSIPLRSRSADLVTPTNDARAAVKHPAKQQPSEQTLVENHSKDRHASQSLSRLSPTSTVMSTATNPAGISSKSSTSSASKKRCHICQLPDRFNKLVACTSCRHWFHKGCDSAASTATSTDTWICKGCTRKSGNGDEWTFKPREPAQSASRAVSKKTLSGQQPAAPISLPRDAVEGALKESGHVVPTSGKMVDSHSAVRKTAILPDRATSHKTTEPLLPTSTGFTAINTPVKAVAAKEDAGPTLRKKASSSSLSSTSSRASEDVQTSADRASRPNINNAEAAGMALLAAPNHELTIRQIIDWICTNIPGFHAKDEKFKTAVSVHLTQSYKRVDAKIEKIDRDRSQGYSLWRIKPGQEHRFRPWVPGVTGTEPKTTKATPKKRKRAEDPPPANESLSRTIPSGDATFEEDAPVEAQRSQTESQLGSNVGPKRIKLTLGKRPGTESEQETPKGVVKPQFTYTSVGLDPIPPAVTPQPQYDLSVRALATQQPEPAPSPSLEPALQEPPQIRKPWTMLHVRPLESEAPKEEPRGIFIGPCVGSESIMVEATPQSTTPVPRVALADDYMARLKARARQTSPCTASIDLTTPVPLEEIRKRPTRKKLIRSGHQHISRLGNNKAREMIDALENSTYRKPDVAMVVDGDNEPSQSTAGAAYDFDPSVPLKCRTLEEVFDMPEKVKAVIHEGELCFTEVREQTTGRPKRTGNVYRIGAAAVAAVKTH